MPYVATLVPQYCDVDPDGMIGPRGYLGLLQTAYLSYYRSFGLGTDELTRTRDIGTMFTRQRIRVLHKWPVGEPVDVRIWVSSKPGAAFIDHEFEVRGEGRLLACARVSGVFFDLAAQKRIAPEQAGMPDAMWEPELGQTDVGPWRDLLRDTTGAGRVASHRVAYTDIDTNHHMNNERYLMLALNAFPRAQYEKHPLAELELHFTAQCREGTCVDVLVNRDQDSVLCVRDDGVIACQALMTFAEA